MIIEIACKKWWKQKLQTECRINIYLYSIFFHLCYMIFIGFLYITFICIVYFLHCVIFICMLSTSSCIPRKSDRFHFTYFPSELFPWSTILWVWTLINMTKCLEWHAEIGWIMKESRQFHPQYGKQSEVTLAKTTKTNDTV